MIENSIKFQVKMVCRVTGILIFLTAFGVVASNPDRAIDCRKFVFAPLCRGVAAKRGQFGFGHTEPPIVIDEKKFLKSLYTALEPLDEEEDDVTKLPTNKQDGKENLIRKYPNEGGNRFLKFLLRNRRMNSERKREGERENNNEPVEEIDNL